MECLGVTNSDKIVKMSEYSENFAKNEMLKVSSIDKIDINLLPLNLRVLKDLDNFEITDDASQVNDVIYKIEIDKNSELDSIDYINELEGSLIDIMVKDLKEKNILIYSLVNNMFIDFGKLVISSRIKIIN